MPRTTSGRSGEQSSSDGKHTAGRRLANAPSSLRSRSNPRSGRRSFRDVVERWPSDRAQQHRPRGKASLQCILRQRITTAGKPGAADIFLWQIEFVAKGRCHSFEHAYSFIRDFGADAVPRKDCDLQQHANLL